MFLHARLNTCAENPFFSGHDASFSSLVPGERLAPPLILEITADQQPKCQSPFKRECRPMPCHGDPPLTLLAEYRKTISRTGAACAHWVLLAEGRTQRQCDLLETNPATSCRWHTTSHHTAPTPPTTLPNTTARCCAAPNHSTSIHTAPPHSTRPCTTATQHFLEYALHHLESHLRGNSSIDPVVLHLLLLTTTRHHTMRVCLGLAPAYV
jgi:hypothetical protein